jgi:hypothetical protein
LNLPVRITILTVRRDGRVFNETLEDDSCGFSDSPGRPDRRVRRVYFLSDRASANWYAADRSSAGVLPDASRNPDAVVRIYAARTVRWRGIVAVHSWIVFKEKGASRYSRYDYTAWGEPIRVDGFVADGRWFGQLPEEVFRADGERAALLILKIRAAIDGYKYRNLGDYRAWPGPNSNTFVAAIIDAVPEMQVVLPPTAIGKDFPTTASGSGGRLPAQVCEPRLEVISASLSGGWKVSNSMCWGPSLVSIFAVLRSRFRVSAGLA